MSLPPSAKVTTAAFVVSGTVHLVRPALLHGSLEAPQEVLGLLAQLAALVARVAALESALAGTHAQYAAAAEFLRSATVVALTFGTADVFIERGTGLEVSALEIAFKLAFDFGARAR